MGREYVGINFHRRRSVVARLSASDKWLSVVRVDNSPAALADAVTLAGDGAEIVIEATYGCIGRPRLLNPHNKSPPMRRRKARRGAA